MSRTRIPKWDNKQEPKQKENLLSIRHAYTFLLFLVEMLCYKLCVQLVYVCACVCMFMCECLCKYVRVEMCCPSGAAHLVSH